MCSVPIYQTGSFWYKWLLSILNPDVLVALSLWPEGQRGGNALAVWQGSLSTYRSPCCTQVVNMEEARVESALLWVQPFSLFAASWANIQPWQSTFNQHCHTIITLQSPLFSQCRAPPLFSHHPLRLHNLCSLHVFISVSLLSQLCF